jgi:hypothetical protein
MNHGIRFKQTATENFPARLGFLKLRETRKTRQSYAVRCLPF